MKVELHLNESVSVCCVLEFISFFVENTAVVNMYVNYGSGNTEMVLAVVCASLCDSVCARSIYSTVYFCVILDLICTRISLLCIHNTYTPAFTYTETTRLEISMTKRKNLQLLAFLFTFHCEVDDATAIARPKDKKILW